MKLYSYWRSTTSYRVRIALNLKNIPFETVPVNLVAGEQRSAHFSAMNPGQGVPVLEFDDGQRISQSMAILEWLEESVPLPPLLPSSALDRARVRAAALCIATDIHPVNNLRVVAELKAMGRTQDEVTQWMNGWMTRGLTAFSEMIDPDSPYCFGDEPGLADLCLIPQLYNAHRWGCDVSHLERLCQIEERCLKLDAFERARPETQPDAS